MAKFELTPMQSESVIYEIRKAFMAYAKGQPGIVLGQIGYNSPNEEPIVCDFRFVEEEKAIRIF